MVLVLAACGSAPAVPSGVEAIKNGWASLHFDQSLAREGFLNQYATASLEEDFNATAQSIFAGSADFWRAVDRYDALRNKTRLAIQFYQALEPMFTEVYFRERINAGNEGVQMPLDVTFRQVQRVPQPAGKPPGFEVE